MFIIYKKIYFGNERRQDEKPLQAAYDRIVGAAKVKGQQTNSS